MISGFFLLVSDRFLIVEEIGSSQTEIGTKHMDAQRVSGVLDMDSMGQKGLVESVEEGFEGGESHQLAVADLAQEDPEGDEASSSGEIGVDECFHGHGDEGHVSIDAIEEAFEENAELGGVDGNQHGEADGGPGQGLDEDHQEAETAEDHQVDILQVGKQVGFFVGIVFHRVRSRVDAFWEFGQEAKEED